MESQTLPSRGSLSNTRPSDGYLLLLSRAGNSNGKDELLKRYYDKRYLVGRSVSPTIIKLLDTWEFNHAFYDAYTSVYKNYTFGANASIKTYFSVLMKNALVSEANSNYVFERVNTISFDEELHSQEGETYTLGDVIADKSEYSNVTYYMDFVDSLDRLEQENINMSKMEKTIVGLRFEGLTFKEIAKALNTSITHAHQVFSDFYKKVKETLEGVGVSNIVSKAKELLKNKQVLQGG